MAEIIQRPKVEVSATMSFSEPELRALDALVGYGVDPFLKVFYEKMGKSYMQPHEQGLRTLFESIRESVPSILRRADDARAVFSGSHLAVPRSRLSTAQAGEKSEWTDCNIRLPSSDDADKNGMVEWLRSGVACRNTVDGGRPVDATHWRRTTAHGNG